ncbi:uncharacterized protein ACHE_20058S [Aspergillus chevalieri]|uniref:C3H1-type domain-containing protein n=1 Tax=Aspergillus chevalieri TaxID=182096 RepID=A0A7R7VH37_ASPCH|nr:uncharacterized protein ACHE_20058S [Aspergillus chevalieri]BCR84600.1 hypothetical protein ACHE_20058S [Aspergillus chevalieri]
MDQTPSQTPTGLPRSSVTASSLPPEYWNTLDSLYPAPDLQQQQQQQPQLPQQSQLPQQPTPSQQPLGISWDHPIFHQQQPQPRNQFPRHQEQNHGIYSPTPQPWQPNPLYQPLMPSSKPQGLVVQPQYSQVHQFPQSQLAFDPQSIPSDSTTLDAIPFPQDFFPSQLSTQPSSQRATPSQPTPAAPYQSNAQQNPINQYSIPAGFPEEASHTPINFPNGFSDPGTSQQTINPLFLNTPHQSGNQQHAPINDNFLYLGPADFERPNNSKPFNYYRNDLQAPPSNHHAIGNQSIPSQFPTVEVVIDNSQAPAFAPDKKPLDPQKKTAAQRQAKTQAKRVGKQAGDRSSSSSDSDDSDIEITLPPEELSPIPETRPSDPLGAARYDALRAVWSPRNRSPNAEKVKNALVAFKNVVKAVRDTWKELSQAMKTAENQGENDKATQLKNEVVFQRRLMDVVVSTTLEMGHPMIVEKLGEHPMAVSAMYSFLLDRHQAADVDGTLTVNILKLLSQFVTVDEDVLQKTNVAKLLPRFSKKGGQTVKDLAKKIQENAAASTKRKQGSKEDSPSKNTTPDATATNGSRVEAAGSKRPRDGESKEGSVQPAAKRMVVTSNTKNPGSTGTANGATAKRPQETGQDAKATAAAAARPKANIVAPKPTNLFGSLSSAKKRPGTSNAERAAAAAAAKTNVPTEKKREAGPPPPKPAFSLGDIMADLDKPKDPGPVEPTEDKPPETEEERKKRLRKEGRRRLRVSWKPDHSLTEVRLFTHDPEEELGPDDRRQRQAGDVKGEGRILRLHKGLDELGEEDEGGIKEENLLGYHEPSEIDNADITPDDRARNYVKRGGTQEPTSPEKQAQEHREATTLMVFYTSLADIPPSPKEPPPPSDDEIVPDVQQFGELPDHVKARQERYFAYVNPKPAPAAQPAAPTNQFDISNLLKIIQSATQQQQPQQPAQPLPPQQPVSQAPTSDLERTVNMFRQQPAPAPLPQMPQFPMPQPQATQGMDFGNILSIMNAQNQMQPPPVFPPAPQSQPGIASNLAAIISQLSNQNQGGPKPPSQVYEDPERKRMRETSGFDGAGDEKFNSSKRNRPNGPHKKHPKVGIVPCRYWKEGKCLKGDDCTFRHDPLI